jgi:uncharacterized protein DUF11
MKNKKHLLTALVAILLFPVIGQADIFTENFNTNNYKDSAYTDANWDTSIGEVRLTSDYTFSQPPGLVNWGGEVSAVHTDGTLWLVGGKGAKINSYNGTSWVNLSPGLANYGNSAINSIWYNSSTWMVAGDGKALNFYDGSVFTDQSGNLVSWTAENINAVRYGGGTETFWLIAGNGGRLNRYNGTWSSLAGSAGFFTTTVNAYAIGFDGTDWLIGGDNGSLCKYSYASGNFTELSFLLRASSFGSNIVRAIRWNGSEWLIGGSGTNNLVTFNGTAFTDQSSNVPTPSFTNVFSIDWDDTNNFWIMVGNGAGTAPRVVTWAGSTWLNQQGSLSNYGTNNPVYAVASDGSGTCLLGGGEARINSRSGNAASTSYTDESGNVRDFGTDTINALDAVAGGNVMVGGNNATCNIYNGASFEDIGDDLATAGWGAENVLAIGGNTYTGNATIWLIGGSSAQLFRYNGVSATDLTSSLGFSGSVRSIRYNGSLWLIGGTNRQLSSYNGSSFTSLDISAHFGATDAVKAFSSGGGIWMIGGDTGSLCSWDGSSFTGITSGFTDINAITYASISGYHRFMVGGTTSPQRVRIYDRDFGWWEWITLTTFSSDTVKALTYSPSFDLWYIAGTNAKINQYDGDEITDLASDLINFGSSAINGMDWNNEYLLFGGGEGRVNKYGPDYDSPKWGQSETVAGSTAFFYSITLTASDNLPAGTEINYWLTVNGQLPDPHSYWIQATPGVATIFDSGFEGTRLQWKAELVSNSIAVSPRIYQIQLEYVIPPTWTNTPTSTPTYTATPSITPTYTITPTITPTATVTPTFTTTPTYTNSPTDTPTYTTTPTITQTSTVSPTPTNIILSSTSTPTFTITETLTVTNTETVTLTRTPTLTITPTITQTSTITDTVTITITPSVTPFYSPTTTPTLTVTETWTASPTATPNPDLTFYEGALIIPMDILTDQSRTNQNYGMWRAYGLVYELLKNGIPVHWAIKSYKIYEEDDFTCTSTKDIRTDDPYTNIDYNGGPFVVSQANSTAAVAIITAWNLGQTNIVQVHQYTDGTGPFNAPIFRKLRAAPKIALYDNSDSRNTWRGARNYLNAAGIRDSAGGTWPSTSPDVLTEAELAGPTTSNHTDGDLFQADGLPAYAMLVNMHMQAYPIGRPNFASNSTRTYGEDWSIRYYEGLAPSAGPGTSSGSYGGGWLPGGEVYENVTSRADTQEAAAEMDYYLQTATGHVYAQCIGVAACENNIVETTPLWNDFVYGGYGHWLTTNGIIDTPTPPGSGALNYVNQVPDSPAGQAVGDWTWASGSQSAFGLAAGSTFYGGESSLIVVDTISPGSYPYLFMNGHYHGVTGAGKISYLIGHTSSYSLPYTGNIQAPMMRYFYNSLFESPAASEAVPEMYLQKSGPADAEIGNNITYSISYQNLSGVAYNVTITDPYPADATYVSSTGGGIPGGGVVTWNLGDLAASAAGTVSVTYSLQDPAPASVWTNQANVVYWSGPTQFTAYSEVVTTNAVVFTPTPSVTSTVTLTPTPTITLTSTSTATLTITPSNTPTNTTTLTITPSNTATPTHTPTLTSTSTLTITPSITITSTITVTFTITPTQTDTPVFTPTTTPTITVTSTVSATYTNTPTDTPTATGTPTFTATSTLTNTPTATPTFTVSATSTISVTNTPTGTVSATPTVTLSGTITETGTITVTATPSGTTSATPVVSATSTPVPPTVTYTVTPTATSTVTPTQTPIPGGDIMVFPNPFNPNTAYEGVLKFDYVPAEAEVKIFTITGELIRTYTGDGLRVTWDGKNEAGEDVVSGVYLYIVDPTEGDKTIDKIFLVR